ncbi:MAG TPA: hypothetical protein PLV42_10945 [bacterium]|nr:hypothetical protein [bacterium]
MGLYVLSKEKAIEELGVTENQLYLLERKGMPVVRAEKEAPQYNLKEIEEWIKVYLKEKQAQEKKLLVYEMKISDNISKAIGHAVLHYHPKI